MRNNCVNPDPITPPEATDDIDAGNPQASSKLGLSLLIALVVGSIIGSGIFDLPQNMAAGAGAGAILIGWTITGIGMLLLVRVYQVLSIRKPEMNNGVYAYARALLGEYAGFNSAWGYWVSAWIGNVSYLVAAFSALGYFFPVFADGNSPAAIAVASIVLWVIHLLVLRGIQGAAMLNAVVTITKIVPLLLFITIVAIAFQIDTFRLDFWGKVELGSIFDQVKSTMLVTVWVFIGIEGANVYSARAKKRENIGRATIVGFLICLFLLMAVSLLSLGVLDQSTLAGLKTPSMAGVLENAFGTWGAVLIYIGLIVSVGGGFLAWMLLAAESLFTPAGGGVMPKWLEQTNKNGVPANALWLTNGMVQLFLILTLFSNASYLALISLSTAMILLPYLFSAAYGLSITLKNQTKSWIGRVDITIAMLATVYCLWLLYAAGFKYLLLASLLYAPGGFLYAWAKHQRKQRIFSTREWVVLINLVGMAGLAAGLLVMGKLSF